MDNEELMQEMEVQEQFERESGTIEYDDAYSCLLYTSPSPRDGLLSRMPSSA